MTEENNAYGGPGDCSATYKRFPIVIERGRGHAPSGIPRGATVYGLRCRYCRVQPGPCPPSHCRCGGTAGREPAGTCVQILYYTIPQTELARDAGGTHASPTVFFSATPAPRPTKPPSNWPENILTTSASRNATRIVSMENSFHGRTMATLSATGQDKDQRKALIQFWEGFHSCLSTTSTPWTQPSTIAPAP